MEQKLVSISDEQHSLNYNAGSASIEQEVSLTHFFLFMASHEKQVEICREILFEQ